MKIQYLFYAIGAVFIFASIMYFAWEFIVELSNPVKFIILIIATLVTFFIGEIFRGSDL